MDQLFRFPDAVQRDAKVDKWFTEQQHDLGSLAHQWFERLRNCGDNVRELLHDGHPTACVEDAAFAYVDAFKSHVNLGFYRGADLPDPASLLLGSGKFMRHVKLGAVYDVDETALEELLRAAYLDMTARLTI